MLLHRAASYVAVSSHYPTPRTQPIPIAYVAVVTPAARKDQAVTTLLEEPAPSAVQPAETSASEKLDNQSSNLPSATLDPTASAYAKLLLVPVFWGSYNPCIRLIYSEDNPLDAATLTGARTAIAATALLTALLINNVTNASKNRRSDDTAEVATNSSQGLSGVKTSSSMGTASAGGPGPFQFSILPPVNQQRLGPILTASFGTVLLAGTEMGLWNFLGTSLQAEGLVHTSATRAGFLVQATALLTPAISYVAGYNIPKRIWLAVAMGLLGSCLVAYDGMQANLVKSQLGFDSQGGELFLFASCFFFSFNTMRLGLYAPHMDSVELTAVKKLSLATASLIWAFNSGHADLKALLKPPGEAKRLPIRGDPVPVAFMTSGTWIKYCLMFLLAGCLGYSMHTDTDSSPSDRHISSPGTTTKFCDGHFIDKGFERIPPALCAGGGTAAPGSTLGDLFSRSPSSLALIAYSALGPGALATYFQTSGQSKIPATQAQLFYSMTPLWSALIAYVVLGDESMGTVAWLGGGMILAATVLAARLETSEPFKVKQ